VNPFDDSPFVVVTANVSSNWEIPAKIEALHSEGVDLRGLTVLRRSPSDDQSRLVGTIRSIEGDEVQLSETFDDIPDSLEASDLCLEPSRESFKRCLSDLIGTQRYEKLESAIRNRIDGERKGPALHKYLSQLSSFFEDESVFLAPGLEANLDGPIVLGNSDSEKVIRRSGEIGYCFNPSRTKRHTVPWFGLKQYGPFDSASSSIREPRVLVVCLNTSQGRAEQFARKLRDGISDKRYYESGFDAVFRTYNLKFDWCIVPDDGAYKDSPGRAFSDAIERYFDSMPKRPSEEYNAALVVVEQEHAFLSGPHNPYLQAKALCLMNGVPTQQIRTETLNQNDYSLQYTLQNITTALYAKFGGIPWTVDQDSGVAHELVIGIDTAEVQENRFKARRRLIGITTVFRGDGSYLLSDLSQKCAYVDYPDILQRTTTRILRKRRNQDGWQKGDKVRIIFHSFKRLRDVEMDRITAECAAEVGDEQEIEFAFLNITKSHPYYLLDVFQPGDHSRSDEPKGEHMPTSGTIAQLSGRKRLVQTLGPSDIPNPQIPLVIPLMVTINNKRKATGIRYFDDLTYLAEQVHNFTGLSWKTVRPVKSPVTMEYSELIARQLGELEAIPDWSPKALDSLLPTSKWFL